MAIRQKKERLFVYGTLKYGQMQQKLLGRKILGAPDILAGYKKAKIFIDRKNTRRR